MQAMNIDKVLATAEKNFERDLEDLKTLVRIPSVSFDGFDKNEVKKSAHAVADLLKKRGLENVQILELPGAHPYAYGEWLKAGPNAPTVILYAHHDVQPPGREELWKSKPFEPTVLEGPGGKRLFGRGTADDKAGVVLHTGAIAAYLEAAGSLPVNVKLVIEGEEEIGSEHLPQFLKTHRKLIDADVICLTDTGNFDMGIPAITVALRGIVGVEVEVRALTKAVHSGMWGGPVPDPTFALTKILSGLVDDEGRIAIPGINEQVRPVSAEEEAEMKRLPFNEKDFREQCGMIPSAKLLRQGPNPIAQCWRYPSLTINAIQASSRKQSGNIINDAAWAKVTIRLVPDMDPQDVQNRLIDFLKKRVPWGLEVTFKPEGVAGPWATEPKGPAFEAAIDAMTKGYGVKPYMLGSGGSIPFVKPFADELGGAPAILVGIEDPHTNAHGENESLLISDFKKGILTQIHFFNNLAERAKEIKK